MTRKDICELWNVDDHGIIRSPGKFEGEKVYAPYFWELYLDGYVGDDEATAHIDVTDEDRAEFPELEGISEVSLTVCDQGFVYINAEN